MKRAVRRGAGPQPPAHLGRLKQRTDLRCPSYLLHLRTLSTGQRFFAIPNGRLVGQLRDVAYQATTTDFWGSLQAVGGPQTYQLGGALNCGKAQPSQIAPVSHGCPAALFRGVNVLNTAHEGSR